MTSAERIEAAVRDARQALAELTPAQLTATANLNRDAAERALQSFATSAWILATERERQETVAQRRADAAAVSQALDRAPMKQAAPAASSGKRTR